MMPFAVAVWMLSSIPWDSGASRGRKTPVVAWGKSWRKVAESSGKFQDGCDWYIYIYIDLGFGSSSTVFFHVASSWFLFFWMCVCVCGVFTIFSPKQSSPLASKKKWDDIYDQRLQEFAPFFPVLGWFFNDGKSGTYWITLQIHVPVAPLVKLKEQLLFGRSGFYEFFSGGCLGSRWREKRKRHRRLFSQHEWGRKGSVNLLPADRIFELRHGDCMKCSHISARNEG